jgi:hypothetical protein
MAATRLRIGVIPAAEHTRRARLWSALQDVYSVSFEGREAGALRELDGAIAFGADAAAGLRESALPALIAYGEERDPRPQGSSPTRPEAPGVVSLERDAALARPLHDARLTDTHAVALAPEVARDPSEHLLASLAAHPAWVLARADGPPLHRVGCLPIELGADEALRERLEPGRCLALLALAQFLANIVTDSAARSSEDSGAPSRAPGVAGDRSTPLHAAFLIDDPNLHRPRYGHLYYRELLADARERGYHLSVAMVPFDGWFADRRVARMFREGARQLSVCIHGNVHDGPELSRPRSLEQGLALGAQALRRMAAFERRSGVRVDRVMVPPHEQISEPMARALGACGFHGLCTTRPYPWLVTSPTEPWLTRPPDAGPLAGWRAAEVVASRLPVLLRADFALHPREDLVLRAFLGQPLILYGHHDLLRDGPQTLAQAATAIDALGEVRWGSLGEIAHAVNGYAAGNDQAPSADALAAIPAPPRRLRPIARRVAAESELRVRTMLAPRGRG